MEVDELQEVLEKLWGKVDYINERTKKHTKYIQELEKQVKKLSQ